MKCTKLLLIFLSLKLIKIRGEETKNKCCELGKRIVEKDSQFTCAKKVERRLQGNFETDDFLGKQSSGTCVEVISDKNIGIFEVKNDAKTIQKLNESTGFFFPKCCPLHYQYNVTTHGCEEKLGGDVSGYLKKNTFVLVGLPDCDVIDDNIFESIENIKLNGIDSILKQEVRQNDEKFCVDSTLDGKMVARICKSDLQICGQKKCIRKCCPDGQSFINRSSSCRDSFKRGIDLRATIGVLSPDDPFVLIHGFEGKMKKMNTTIYKFFIDRFGVFNVYMNKTDSYEHYDVSDSTFCVEHAFKEKNGKTVVDDYMIFARLTQQPPRTPMNILISRWPKIISCIALVLTMAVYLLLPKMRNLFGKILLSYCLSTLILFSCLSLTQFFISEFSDSVCRAIGTITVLSTLWSFTWLQIMCFDIWFFFGTPRCRSGPHRKEWKRYIQYSLYGWGFPILWVGMMTIFSVTTMMPESIYPVIGDKKCLLEDSEARPGNYSFLVYITFPLFIQQIINTILFIKTIRYCLKIKAEIEKMKDSERTCDLNASRERLALIVKLAVIMGVFFIFETLSSFVNLQKNSFTKIVEIIWDSVNCLQGLFIFIIFICKRNVYNNIYEAIPCVQKSESESRETVVSMYSASETQK